MNKSLLDRAKDIPTLRRRNSKISHEEMELALAWVKGQITLSQIDRVLKNNKSHNYTKVYQLLATALKEYIVSEKLTR